MRRLALGLGLTIGFSALFAPAIAAPVLSPHVIQKGMYVKRDCKSEIKQAEYDECRCEADVVAPVLSGLTNKTLESQLNAQFLKESSEALCDGVKDDNQPESGKENASVTNQYALSFRPHILSDTLLSFVYEFSSYSGGAHGNSRIVGKSVRLDSGKVLALTDVLDPAKEAQINEFIRKNLAARPEGEIFPETLEDGSALIAGGVCKNCDFVVTNEGIQLIYNAYAIGPYASGPIFIMLPPEFIKDPIVKEALSKKS